MNITLSDIVEAKQTKSILYVESDEDILRVLKLCRFFNLGVPKIELIKYYVTIKGLNSDNGKQVLVSYNGKTFFVGKRTTIAKKHSKLLWEQIPNELKRFAKVTE